MTDCISTTTMLMDTKQGTMMTYLEWLLPIKSHDRIIMWSCNSTWQTKISICSLTQCLWLCLWLSVLARGRYRVSFHKIIRSFDHVVLLGHINYFSCCITTTIRAMATKLGKVVTCERKFNLLSHTILLTGGYMRSRDKIKTFYLHYRNTKPGSAGT